MKKLFLIGVVSIGFIIALAMLFVVTTSAEEISGGIYGGLNDHWGISGNVKSPVIINSQVVIEADAKLVIEPGTLILFTGEIPGGGYISIKKGGSLIAEGTSDNWVIFSSAEDYYPSRIRVDGGNVILKHCFFDNIPAIDLIYAEIKMERCIMKREKLRYRPSWGLFMNINCTSAKIISNLFVGMSKDEKGGTGYIFVCGSHSPTDNYPVVIEKNIFKNNEAGSPSEQLYILNIDERGSALIRQNIIKNNKNAIGIYIGKVKFENENCGIFSNLITGNGKGIVFDSSLESFPIKNNAIYKNYEYDFYSKRKKVDVSSNYWGTESPDMKKNYGPINFLPYLKEPPFSVPVEKDTGVPTWTGLIATWVRMLENKDSEMRNYVVNCLDRFEDMNKRAAVEANEKTLELEMEDYYQKGIIYGIAGQFERAKQSFLKALEADHLRERAKICLELTEDILEQKLKTDAAFHMFKGITYHNTDIYNDRAIVEYRKVIDIYPNYALAHNNLAVVYYKNEDYNLAIRHCDVAIKNGFKVNSKFLEAIEVCRIKQQMVEELEEATKASEKGVTARKWQGSENRTTELFKIDNNKWSIYWEGKGGSVRVFIYQVYDSKSTLIDGFSGHEGKRNINQCGVFYIEIASNYNWEVSIDVADDKQEEEPSKKGEKTSPEKVISQREIKYNYYVSERFGEYESKLQGKVISDYDERKNKIREIYYDKKGKAQSKITYEYNDKGDEIRKVTSVIKNNILEITEERVYRYKYDEKGNKIEKDYYYNSEGRHLAEKIVYEYNDEGNETKRIYYEGQGAKKGRIIFRYDENNNIEEIEEIYRWEKTLQKYDKDGSSVKNVFHSGRLLYEIFYNPNGKMVEKKQYDPYGKVVRGILCNFDVEGRIVEEVSYRYEEKFGKTQEVPFRKILYEYQSQVELRRN